MWKTWERLQESKGFPLEDGERAGRGSETRLIGAFVFRGSCVQGVGAGLGHEVRLQARGRMPRPALCMEGTHSLQPLWKGLFTVTRSVSSLTRRCLIPPGDPSVSPQKAPPQRGPEGSILVHTQWEEPRFPAQAPPPSRTGVLAHSVHLPVPSAARSSGAPAVSEAGLVL